MSPAPLPERLERDLLALYELHVPLSVAAVLTSDTACLDAHLPRGARRPPEVLLVRQDTDGVAIGLYLAADVLEHLQRDDPYARLHDDNLGAFLLAVEGVSHYVCLAWNAQHDREISALELELQAEVDKFLCVQMLAERQGSAAPRGTLQRLFGRVRYDPALDADERWRYRTAHAWAHRYCARLASRWDRHSRRSDLVRELRRFYRLSVQHKRAHIERG